MQHPEGTQSTATVRSAETTPGDPRQPVYAHVVLPIPVDQAFTYSVPGELSTRVFVGCRVEVDFGRRVLSGVVVALTNETDVERVRPLRSVSDTYLTPQLLELSDWIAAYYGCSRGESVQSVLPPKMKRAKVRPRATGLLRLAPSATGDGEDAATAQLSRARKQLTLFRRLADVGGEAALDTVAREWGIGRPIVDGLIAKGLATLEPLDRTSPLDGIESDVERLTPSQQSALDAIDAAIDANAFAPFLLYGVTGSGKTEVYLRAARRALDAGGSCLVLVPEIGLLPQATTRYRKMFGGDVAIIHSRLTGPERYDIWERVASGDYRVVVGPRSAVFSPLKNLRLIIVDEEQDESYKQDDKPRYHARNVALIRGKFENVAVVLGSATPSAETLKQSQDERYELLTLPERAGGAPLPRIELIDMRKEEDAGLFSRKLIEKLDANIAAGKQSIVFLNKRGHARYVQCNACGWVGQCKNCDISLTYHRVDNTLRCHFCGYQRRSVTRCDACHSPRIRFSGVGTQRVELELNTLFPGVDILRMDADTTSGKDGHRRVLEQFSTGDYPILLGTQMVTKGHHFPGVNLVGVLHAEESLNFPDFRSAERTFRQLTQVAGRAGRAENSGEVYVQSYMPDHYVFRYLESHDYTGFMNEELEFRRQLRYPPFSRLVLAAGTARNPAVLHVVMEQWAARMRGLFADGDVQVLGPTPPPVARVRNRYREQILIKGPVTAQDKTRVLAVYGELVDGRKGAGGIELRWDVDPESFL